MRTPPAAGKWSESRKRQFANDLSFDGHLVAVHGPANQAKGMSGPDSWRPPEEAFWCRYAIDWITVKNSWELTATEAEVAALSEMLETCEPPRVLQGIGPEARPLANATPEAAPTAIEPTEAASDRVYASCDEAAAAGEERVLGSSGSGRGFPQSIVPDARDGDGDGVVCEQ